MELNRICWSEEDYTDLLEYLKGLGDECYKRFNTNIIPDAGDFIGVRIPVLRKAAAEIAKGDYKGYLALKKGDIHEEIMLEGLVMTNIKCGYTELLEYMKYYAAKIRNWAACDTVSFKRIKRYRSEMIEDIGIFTDSENPWFVRYGLKILMDFFLDSDYAGTALEITEKVKNSFYYVEMMQAWLIATAFAKQRNLTLEFMRSADISEPVFKKAVQKIRESSRISGADKEIVKNIGRG